MSKVDCIFLEGVRVPAQIGVPDEERAQAQSLELDLKVYPSKSLQGLEDSIEGTIDYGAVAAKLFEIAAERPRRLIETLAEDIAAGIFAEFDAAEITVKISKQILPGMKAAGLVMQFVRDEI